MAENPENYSYHRGLQSCILKNGDFIDGEGIDLPVLHVKLTDEQVNNVVELNDNILCIVDMRDIHALCVWLTSNVHLTWHVAWQTSTLLEMYDVLALQQPRCTAHRHIPLMFATGDAYTTRARKLLRSSIVKVGWLRL